MFLCTVRMIGHYVRHIKSRKHPEKNIVNRVMLESAAKLQASIDGHTLQAQAEEERDADDDAAGYAVAPSCTNSLILPGTIRWPALNDDNSATLQSVRSMTKLERAEFLVQRVGMQTCLVHAADVITAPPLVVQMDSSKIWIGAWCYATSTREKRNRKMITTQSWFAILARNVHGYVEAAERMKELDPELVVEDQVAGYLYGRLRMFNHITVQGWNCNPFSIAQCWLFKPVSTDPQTGLSTINVSQRHELTFEYVDMSKIECPIALGPVVTGWNKDSKDAQAATLRTQPDCFVAMHCVK